MTRPNDNDFALARLKLRDGIPQNGTFMFGRDFRPRNPEFQAADIALLRGRVYTDEEIRAALDGDGQVLYEMGCGAQDGLWVCFSREGSTHPPELREVWCQVRCWNSTAFAAFSAQVDAAR